MVPSGVPDTSISPADLRRLAAIAARHGLEEIVYESPDLTLRIRSGVPSGASVAAALPEIPVSATGPRSAVRTLDAPIMGVFYRSPAPGEPPFVEAGDSIEVGQPIGMIEAMKVFSEVPAEIGGRVATILVENGTLVQPGDPLIALEGA